MAMEKIGNLAETKPIAEQSELNAVLGRIAEIDKRLGELAAALEGDGDIATVLTVIKKLETSKAALKTKAENLKGEIANKQSISGDAIGKVLALVQKTGTEDRQQLRQFIRQLVVKIDATFTRTGRGAKVENTANLTITRADGRQWAVRIEYARKRDELVTFVENAFVMAVGA
jgi:cysteinyl-tRNA synthetase